MANNYLNRFFGGPPLSVIFRLILLSILIGVILEVIGLDPWNLIESLKRLVLRIWDMGFDAVRWLWRYLLLGAAVGTDLVRRARHARGQGPMIVLTRRPDFGPDFGRTWRNRRNLPLCRPLLRRHRGSVCPDKLVDSRLPSSTQHFRQLGFDGRDESQPVKHERAVELDQGRTRSDLRNSRLARVDAAHADERERTLDPHIGLRQHARREREQRTPRQAPWLPCRRLIAASAAAPAWCCR